MKHLKYPLLLIVIICFSSCNDYIWDRTDFPFELVESYYPYNLNETIEFVSSTQDTTELLVTTFGTSYETIEGHSESSGSEYYSLNLVFSGFIKDICLNIEVDNRYYYELAFLYDSQLLSSYSLSVNAGTTLVDENANYIFTQLPDTLIMKNSNDIQQCEIVKNVGITWFIDADNIKWTLVQE